MNGFEVPCICKVKGPKFILERIEMLKMDYLKEQRKDNEILCYFLSLIIPFRVATCGHFDRL